MDTALDVLTAATRIGVSAFRPTPRETFASRLGTLMTIVGVPIGLGHVWRFPYMVGKFGGAAFVLFYILVSIVIGVPGADGGVCARSHTRRGPVGAFALSGLPFGRYVGWFFFFVVTAATGYYSAVIGWVLYYTIGQLALGVHIPLDRLGHSAARSRVRAAKSLRAATGLHGDRDSHLRGRRDQGAAAGHRAREQDRAADDHDRRFSC